MGHHARVQSANLSAPGRMARNRPDVARLAAWAPVALVAVGAALPTLRVVAVAVVAAGALFVTFRSGRRSVLAGAWLGALPAGLLLALAVTLAPSVPLAGSGSCTDPLSPPAVARAIEALIVLAAVLLLIPLTGRGAALRLRWPSASATTLAVLAPFVIVPLTLWIGPPIAEPFFGRITLATDDLAALLPAALFALSNAAQEEAAYRGALLGWSAPALGVRGALIGQAVIFGFAHMGSDVEPLSAPFLWAGMALSGLLAGLVVVRTRSLFLALLAHAAIDVPLYYALACRIGA